MTSANGLRLNAMGTIQTSFSVLETVLAGLSPRDHERMLTERMRNNRLDAWDALATCAEECFDCPQIKATSDRHDDVVIGQSEFTFVVTCDGFCRANDDYYAIINGPL